MKIKISLLETGIKGYKNLLIALFFFVFLALTVIYLMPQRKFTNMEESLKVSPPPTQHPTAFGVKEIVDGDTIVLESEETVRYLGIDTPELHHPTTGEECGGKEAKEENIKLIAGKKIKLEKDVTDKDQYGRLLRFVFTEDGEFVNYRLVRNGWAQVLAIPPDKKFEKLFIDAQLTAKKEGLGIWEKCFSNKERR